MFKNMPLFLVLFSYNVSVIAMQLTGEGYGVTAEDARNNAMASLSESIKIEVKSVFQSEADSSGNYDATKQVQTISALPLLGIGIDQHKSGNSFICIASLSSEKSIGLYKKQLKTLRVRIEEQYKRSQHLTDKAEKYRVLNQLLTDINQYDNYLTVAQMLGATHIPAIRPNKSRIKSKIVDLETAAPNLQIAATVLTKGLPAVPYYIHPILPQGSSQATQLSRQLRNNIMSSVKSYDNHKQAKHFIKGRYEALNDGIAISLQAINDDGQTLASRVVKITPSAYKGIEYESSTINFDQLLHNGYIVSNEFSAHLTTNQGNEDLLFIDGEAVELFAKLNRSGYFYIVSHSLNDDSSYLLELNDAKGERSFVRFVNADDVNKWISLGEFVATEPFGTEGLQLIASNKDLIHKLPKTVYDASMELYKVAANTARQAVAKTRALKPKEKKGNKLLFTETTMTLTTMDK